MGAVMLATCPERSNVNWTKGLLRLWVVGTILWVVTFGWIEWPGDAPQTYLRYWYYRVAHPEWFAEGWNDEYRVRTGEPNREGAIAELKARSARAKMEAEGSNQGTREELYALLNAPPYMNKLGDQELERIAETPVADDPAAARLRSLETDLSWSETRLSRSASYALLPPALVFILGASLLWALRGFARTPRSH